AAAAQGPSTQRGRTGERINVSGDQLVVPNGRRSPSQISDFAKWVFQLIHISDLYLFFESCPVCEQPLGSFGSVSEQEAHVKNCLEGGSESNTQLSRYVN